MAKNPDKGGRPTVYDPEQHPKLARELTAKGRTTADIAEVFGVARSTFIKWQSEHVEFSVAINLGREDRTDRVERALFERAIGYVHPAEKIVVVDHEICRVPYDEHYPPDPAALKFYLTNRRSQDWQEKAEVKHSGTVSVDTLRHLSNEQLQAEIKKAQAELEPTTEVIVKGGP